MSYVDRSETRQYSAGFLFAIAAGYLSKRVLGIVALLPVVVGFASFYLLRKVVDRNIAVIAAMAAIIAQTGWFLIGAVAMPSHASDVILDIVINCVLLAAIFFRPGYVSAVLTILWNLAGIAFTGLQLASAPTGGGSDLLSVDQRALIAHLVLRLIITSAAVAIIIFKANPDLIPTPDEDDSALDAA
jgi:hypothetical protein